MQANPFAFAEAVDSARLDKLAEVAIKVGLQLQPGQDLVMTAPVGGAAAGAADHRACLQGRRRAGHDRSIPTRRRRWRATATRRTRASTAPPAGSTRAWPRPSATTPRGSRSPATIRCCWPAQDPDKVAARQPRQFDGLQAGAGEDHRLRHQLEHRLLSQPRLGAGRCSRTTPRTRRCASWRTRSSPPRASTSTIRSRPGASTMRRCASAPTWLNDQRFAALHFTGPGHRPDGRARRRPRMAGRRVDGQERHHLQSEHPDRGGVHHAARAAGRRPCPLRPSRCATRAR